MAEFHFSDERFKGLWLVLVAIPHFASAGCAGNIGLRAQPNAFKIACEHQIEFLNATDGEADQRTINDSVADLRADAERERSPDTKVLFVTIADAAQRGDPEPARNNVELNCQSTLRDLQSP